VRLDDVETFCNFSILICAVCWNHSVVCVFQTELQCMLYIPMALRTSPLLTLLYTAQHKNVSLLCQTLYCHSFYFKSVSLCVFTSFMQLSFHLHFYHFLSQSVPHCSRAHDLIHNHPRNTSLLNMEVYLYIFP
jgi:hypothetical protein